MGLESPESKNGGHFLSQIIHIIVEETLIESKRKIYGALAQTKSL